MLKQTATMLRALVCLSCLALPIASRAECRKALDKEIPHGANELIELKEQTVNGLFGTIFFPNQEPASQIVVEVYRHAGKQEYSETIQQERLAACVTGADGKFSFPEL